MPTITEQINAYRNEILNKNPGASRLAEILVQLSALSGNVADEIIEREYEYSEVYNLATDLTENNKPISAAKAEIKAMVSKEYLAYQKAKAVGKMVDQMIGSIKYLIKVKENEYRNSTNQ